MSSYVEVAVGRLARLFHYRLPSSLNPHKLQPGARLLVPFGHRVAIAYFIRFIDQPSVEETKEVLASFDDAFPLPPHLNKLLQWIHEYYLAPLGAVIQMALPKEGYKVVRQLKLTDAGRAALASNTLLSPTLRQILTKLIKNARTDVLFKKMEKDLKIAIGHHWIQPSWDIQMSEFKKKATRTIATPDPILSENQQHTLNPDQQAAFDPMESALKAGRFAPFLLHGVTGSGKTEIYLHLVERALKSQKGSIVLVPEIGLTPQLVTRFTQRFGSAVALLHSGLSSSERNHAWHRLYRKEARIAIGTRSALFAPIEEIGVIIVDEEHDPSYKQESGVRYHARDAALVYGKILNAVVVLGSATPSMESLHNVLLGKYTRVTLPKRVLDRPLPDRVIVDLCCKEQWVRPFLTSSLVNAVQKRLNQKEQVILFVNRRGHCPALLCGTCGRTWRCAHCSVTLVFHKARKRLLCHYCGFGMASPICCPDCQGTHLLYLGVGTEQIEEEIKSLFPSARVLRMDRDTTSHKASYEKMISAMESGQADILIGTQMVAKGHDFPNVTLVGVICADHSFNQPDFRASERTFQLLVQVTGRAGRGHTPGEVLLQTFQPEYPLFTFLPDTDKCYGAESVYRKEAGYPPYNKLLLLRLYHRNEDTVVREAEHLAKAIKSQADAGVMILGPAPAPIARVRKEYGYQILLKGKRPAQLRAVVHAGRNIVTTTQARGVRMIVDMDPQHLS